MKVLKELKPTVNKRQDPTFRFLKVSKVEPKKKKTITTTISLVKSAKPQADKLKALKEPKPEPTMFKSYCKPSSAQSESLKSTESTKTLEHAKFETI
jgi:hypothetical protein